MSDYPLTPNFHEIQNNVSLSSVATDPGKEENQDLD